VNADGQKSLISAACTVMPLAKIASSNERRSLVASTGALPLLPWAATNLRASFEGSNRGRRRRRRANREYDAGRVRGSLPESGALWLFAMYSLSGAVHLHFESCCRRRALSCYARKGRGGKRRRADQSESCATTEHETRPHWFWLMACSDASADYFGGGRVARNAMMSARICASGYSRYIKLPGANVGGDLRYASRFCTVHFMFFFFLQRHAVAVVVRDCWRWGGR